jgi:hypothetical protein
MTFHQSERARVAIRRELEKSASINLRPKEYSVDAGSQHASKKQSKLQEVWGWLTETFGLAAMAVLLLWIAALIFPLYFGFANRERTISTLDETIANLTAHETRGWSLPAIEQASEKGLPGFYRELASRMESFGESQFGSNESLRSSLQHGYLSCQTLRSWALLDAGLTSSDRQWLLDRCSAWAEGFEEDLADLAAKPETAVSVRTDAKSRIKRIAAALRERADQKEV